MSPHADESNHEKHESRLQPPADTWDKSMRDLSVLWSPSEANTPSFDPFLGASDADSLDALFNDSFDMLGLLREP